MFTDHTAKHLIYNNQGQIQDLVLGGTKFGKVIWEYYYYCLICLWNVWCRKIKIDLQVIMIIWGEETEPLFSLSVFCLLHLFFYVYLGFFGFFRGGRTSLPPPLNLPVIIVNLLSSILIFSIQYEYDDPPPPQMKKKTTRGFTKFQYKGLSVTIL